MMLKSNINVWLVHQSNRKDHLWLQFFQNLHLRVRGGGWGLGCTHLHMLGVGAPFNFNFKLQLQKCLFDTNHSKIQKGNIQQITLEKKNYQYILITKKTQSVRRPLLRLSNRLHKGHLERVSCHQNCQYSQSWTIKCFSMWWLRA